MTTSEQDAFMKKAVFKMMVVETPGVILLVVGLFLWGQTRQATHSSAIELWEAACLLLGAVLMGFSVWRFTRDVKAAGVKPQRRC